MVIALAVISAFHSHNHFLPFTASSLNNLLTTNFNVRLSSTDQSTSSVQNNRSRDLAELEWGWSYQFIAWHHIWYSRTSLEWLLCHFYASICILALTGPLIVSITTPKMSCTGLLKAILVYNMNSKKLVFPLLSLYWSIHTKDESKRGTAFAFIFGVNWLWRCVVSQHRLKSFFMK